MYEGTVTQKIGASQGVNAIITTFVPANLNAEFRIKNKGGNP
jgi:hypothetical protein